jgi:hypothetical protein
VQLETFKNRYKILQASLAEDFLKNPDLVSDLVQQRSDAIDTTTLKSPIFAMQSAISRVACPTSNPTSHKKARNLDRLC